MFQAVCTIALISHASKVMLKMLQARLQQYVNREIPDVQAGFRKVFHYSIMKKMENILATLNTLGKFHFQIVCCFALKEVKLLNKMCERKQIFLLVAKLRMLLLCEK